MDVLEGSLGRGLTPGGVLSKVAQELLEALVGTPPLLTPGFVSLPPLLVGLPSGLVSLAPLLVSLPALLVGLPPIAAAC